MNRFRDIHEERLTHRLEAFSDIVMGFSLAQMSLNFVIPNRAAEVYTNPTQLIAFAFTFLLVSLTWYAHHRLFDYFFVPRADTITLNFVTLALVVWLVYQLQIYARFATTSDHTFAATSYIVTFAIVWTLLAVLYARCARILWPELRLDDRRGAVMSIGRIGCIGAGTLVAVAVLLLLHLPVEISFWLIPVWATLWRLSAPRALARIEA